MTTAKMVHASHDDDAPASTLKVKGATVTFVEGKTVGYNAKGTKEEADGPNKGKLKTEGTVDLREAVIRGYKEGDKPDTSVVIKPAQIRPGDKISAGWGKGTDPNTVPRPTSATVVHAKPTV